MLSQPAPAEKIKVEEPAKTTCSWNGVSLPDCTEREREVIILKITLAPKAKVPMHIHPIINAGYMLSGEVPVEIIVIYFGEEGQPLSITL